MTVDICGIPHEVKYVDSIDEELDGITQGKILYSKGIILIRKDLPKEIENEVLIHEITHGMLMHLGKHDMSSDEEFVQLLAHGINMCFVMKGGNE